MARNFDVACSVLIFVVVSTCNSLINPWREQFVSIAKFHIRSGSRLKNNDVIDGLYLGDVLAIGLDKSDVFRIFINTNNG